jgi:phosphopantothenate---cysteine ligase (CTP)
MNCIVTAGPTYERLDEVRKLTNFSTGRLGTELANFLAARGHEVTLLIGEQATYAGARNVPHTETFTTTADLQQRLRALTDKPVDAIFHAAAVSDFTFGKIWLRSSKGELQEIKSKKISTEHGAMLAELVPTPKIIAELREWFPKARIIGWKFETDGGRAEAIREGERQIVRCLTDACVVNGPAYGEGFGLVKAGESPVHLPGRDALFQALEKF